MTKYALYGDRTFVMPDDNAAPVVTDDLPPGVYVVNNDPIRGLYLQATASFKNPSRVYGHTYEHAERILKTFEDRGRNTGVLLTGEKGAGKTLLAREICIRAANRLPVILIDSPYCGDEFNLLFRSITQPCIIFIDETEKVYEKEQNKLLPLLDGSVASNKLILLTSNDTDKISEFMINRPGRVFYLMEFVTLEEDAIREYVTENMVNKNDRDYFIKKLVSFDTLTFDMMTAVIEEKNRYEESFEKVMATINVRNTVVYSRREISMTYKGQPIPPIQIVDRIVFNDLDDDDDLQVSYRYMRHPDHPARECVNISKKDRGKGGAHADEIFKPEAFLGYQSRYDREESSEKGEGIMTLVYVQFTWENLNEDKTNRDVFVFETGDYTISYTRVSAPSYRGY